MRAFRLGASLLLFFPAAAWAVLTIDDIRWPESGAYPAYPEALSAAATGRRFHAYVYGGVYSDDNLFRLSANPQSDRFTKLGLGLRADFPISRQRLLLEAQIDDNRFDKFGALDHTGGRASAIWNWQVGNSWEGNLRILAARAIGFGQIQARSRTCSRKIASSAAPASA
jgi:hypothetical protein